MYFIKSLLIVGLILFGTHPIITSGLNECSNFNHPDWYLISVLIITLAISFSLVITFLITCIYPILIAVGVVPSPFDCYSVNRGLKTLHIRMREHERNATAVAKHLESSPHVVKVFYPGMYSRNSLYFF